jgi:hypothetical protein
MNHNQERFAQITGNSQAEFQQAWDELVRYATDKARGYFDDGVSLDEAMDEVMSGVTDWLIKISHNPELLEGVKNPWGYVKKLIYNHLKKLSRERDYRPSSLGSINGGMDSDNDDEDDDAEITSSSYRAFTPVEKPIKARDSIIVLYAYGESKDEIVKDCGVSRRYVNMVIHESAREIEALKALKSGIGN